MTSFVGQVTESAVFSAPSLTLARMTLVGQVSEVGA
jgi:hypothetical protein